MRKRRRGFWKTAGILTVELAAALVAGVAILGGFVIWRLSQGPLELTFLTPIIQDALDRPESPVGVHVGSAQVIWENWDRAVEVRALDVVVRARADGAVVLTLPEVAIGLTLAGIDSGVVAPTSVRLTDAVLAVRRLEDGRLSLSLDPSGERVAELSAGDGVQDSAVPAATGGITLLDALLRPPGEKGFAGALTRFEMRNARVRLTDAILGLDMVAEEGNLVITRDENGISGQLDAQLWSEDERIPIQASARKAFSSSEITLNLGFKDMRAAGLKGMLPAIEPILVGMDVPVSGTLRTAFTITERPRSASLALTSPVGGLMADIDWDGPGNPMEAVVDLREVNLALLAERAPELAAHLPLRASLGGKLHFLGDPVTGQGDIEMALEAGPGALVAPELWPEPLPIGGASLQGMVSDLGASAVLDYLRVDIGQGAAMAASGRIEPVEDKRRVTLSVALTDVDATRLPVLWPPSLAPNPREWVTGNIPAGFVPRATAEVVVDLQPDLTAEPVLVDLSGAIDIQKAEVHYLRPLPPVTEASGRAIYGPNWMTIEGESGRLLNSRLGKSRLEITDIGGGDDMVVSVALTGPLGDALEILDHERFGFIKALGMDRNGLSGEASANLWMNFELKRALKLEELAVKAKARIRNLAQPKGPLDFDVRADAVELEVDTKGLTASGPVRLNGIPFDLAWDERFSASEPRRSRYDLRGSMPVADLARLGLDAGQVATGRVTGSLRYDIARDGTQNFAVSADLGDAALTLPDIGFEKPAGQPAQGELAGRITGADAPVALSRLSLDGPDLAIDLHGMLAPRFKGLSELTVRRAKFGATDVSGAISALPDGGYRAGLAGPSLDAGFHFEREEEEKDPAAVEEPPGPPLQINLAVDRLLTTQGHALQGVTARIQRGAERMERVEVDAHTGPDAPLSIRYLPDGQRHDLTVDIADAGAALTALGWTGRIQGGRLKLTGHRAEPDTPLLGAVEMEEFTVRDAPAMVKVLEFLSFTGALSALRESGLGFQKLEGRYSWLDGKLDIEFARAFGSSIGITVRGRADTDTDQVDMEGAVIPAYLVNRVLGDIPILGWIITGGEGEGLFAANYAVHGPIEDPTVTVNPLSVLAPGFLRQLLGLEASGPGSGQAPPSVPTDRERE